MTNLLQNLSIELGVGRHDLLRIIESAPKRYKVYEIPKRQGRGTRIIAQPSRELKEVQRVLLRGLLSKLPVHKAATAYSSGRSIADNARAHIRGKVILKLDFKDFFPSVRVRDWERYARSSKIDFQQGEIALYSKILFWGQGHRQPQCLSIGAPTSPIVSNILLFELDTLLSQAARKLRVSYTRYADDITASADRISEVIAFEKTARSIVRELKSPRLVFNEDKRGIYTMGERRMVTGLILTPTRAISIGRERKRLISAMLHRSAHALLGDKEAMMLKGLLGFCLANEPDFVSRMRVKYGNSVIDSALRYESLGDDLSI